MKNTNESGKNNMLSNKGVSREIGLAKLNGMWLAT